MGRVIMALAQKGQAVFMSVSRKSFQNLLFCQNRSPDVVAVTMACILLESRWPRPLANGSGSPGYLASFRFPIDRMIRTRSTSVCNSRRAGRRYVITIPW